MNILMGVPLFQWKVLLLLIISQLELMKSRWNSMIHTLLSDCKLQDSSIVYSHMDKLILKETDIITADKTVLYCHTDGCK